MSPAGMPAAALTNEEAAELIRRLQELDRELKRLQAGLARLLEQNSPVPVRNAQLRRLCSELARLLAESTTHRH